MKNIFKIIKILSILILICFLLNYYSYRIPSNNIKNNIIKSFNYSNYYLENNEKVFVSNISRTEFIMISEVLINKTNNTLVNSLKNYYIYTDKNFKNELIKVINNNSDKNIKGYSRYWHGYIFPLKILLNIFSIIDLKFINYFFQNLCIIIISILLYKNNLNKYILSFISSIFLMFPFFTSQLFSQTIILNLTLIFSIILLLVYKKIKTANIKYLFMIIGALTNYFDFFTYPLVCLGYLLLLYTILNNNFKLKNIINMSIFFFIGYSILWASKWLLTDILLKENNLLSILKTIKFRSSTYLDNKYLSLKDTFLINFKHYLNYYTLFIVFINLIYLIKELILFIKNKANLINKLLPKIISYLFISIMPIIWYVFIREHSFEHHFYSYRLLTITFLSLNFMFLSMFKTKER